MGKSLSIAVPRRLAAEFTSMQENWRSCSKQNLRFSAESLARRTTETHERSRGHPEGYCVFERGEVAVSVGDAADLRPLQDPRDPNENHGSDKGHDDRSDHAATGP